VVIIERENEQQVVKNKYMQLLQSKTFPDSEEKEERKKN